MLEYVIEGHDGSAKTPIAGGIKNNLTALGYQCKVYSPFHIANSLIDEDDIYVYWKTGREKTAVELLQKVIHSIRTQNFHLDVLIFDRHWLTVLGEIDDHENLRNLWADFPPTFFIEAPIHKTLDCKRFSYETLWTSSNEQVEYYYHRLLNLAQKYKQYIIDQFIVETRIQPLDPIINSITQRIQYDLKNIH